LAIVRRIALLLAAAALAGCGGSSKSSAPTTAPSVPAPGAAKVLYQGSGWAVVVDGDKARAFHLVGGRWLKDASGKVKISILGPTPKSSAAAIPQVAAELSAGAALVDSALWVDGIEVNAKGGGLTPKRGTIYGAPTKALKRGTHVAVAYARTATHATAVAWSFHVS
jgi:hypothetical protein